MAIVNHSTVVDDAAVKAAIPAFATQASCDFRPIWPGPAVTVAWVDNKPLPTDWVLGIFDNSDQPGALGYHDRTATGLPLGKVFAKTDLLYGDNWTVTLSHELLEMLADQEINQTKRVGWKRWAVEVCDPCEADSQGYQINGTWVSDFVTPAWFGGKKGPYDFMKRIPKALGILPGGYAQWQSFSGTWHQVYGQGSTFGSELAPRYRDLPAVGSRRERRVRGHDGWLDSD